MNIFILITFGVALILFLIKRSALSFIVLAQLIAGNFWHSFYISRFDYSSWLYYFALYFIAFAAALCVIIHEPKKKSYLIFIPPMIYNIFSSVEISTHGEILSQVSRFFHANITNLEYVFYNNYSMLMMVFIAIQLIVVSLSKGSTDCVNSGNFHNHNKCGDSRKFAARTRIA